VSREVPSRAGAPFTRPHPSIALITIDIRRGSGAPLRQFVSQLRASLTQRRSRSSVLMICVRRDASIEQRHLQHSLLRMRFRGRATVPDDTQCVAGISPLAAGPASNGPVDRSRQLQPSQPAAANQQQRSFSWRAIFGNFQTWQLVVPKTYYLNKY
jgi:hypothetical protein